MSETVFGRVESLLQHHQVVYDISRHEPVYTSQQAATVRGVPLGSGAKALICKANDRFVMFVIPADCKLDSKAARQAQGWKKLRFATADEVLEMTGLRPGAIPPFGRLFNLQTFCDPLLGQHEKINFNAGDHCISASMRYVDYIQVEQPTLIEALASG